MSGTDWKEIYSELRKRLEAAFIVAGLGEWTEDWNKNIEAIRAMGRANVHLAKLASSRHDRILELERQLADCRPPNTTIEYGSYRPPEPYGQPEKY